MELPWLETMAPCFSYS